MYIVDRVLFMFKCISSNVYCSKGLIVYIVELVLFKVFNGVYRRTCTVQRVMVYNVELVLFKGFNFVYRRTCTVLRV